jgi:CelD/BcsL family acetyltransferase involved in cellulose biosynthesis
MDGSDAELALFAVESQGEIIATLFGIVHDGAFTLLRISTAGQAWGHLSPGRLIVVEAMKYFVAFDMGIGDYPFKRGFGVEDVPLYDLIVARDLLALPGALFHRLKGRLRRNKLARAVYQRFKPNSAH